MTFILYSKYMKVTGKIYGMNYYQCMLFTFYSFSGSDVRLLYKQQNIILGISWFSINIHKSMPIVGKFLSQTLMTSEITHFEKHILENLKHSTFYIPSFIMAWIE